MDRVGLCADCLHVRVVASERGSTFYLCGAAARDPRLKKYPALPRLSCHAHESRPADTDPEPGERG